MGMPKIDINAMYSEIEKTDPEAITEYGIIMNKNTIEIMKKYGYLQDDNERKKAINFNKELLKKFKNFLKNRKNKDKIYSDIYWYSKCNEMSGCVLKFTEMDKEHFNYILFNRAIRKVIGMSVKNYLEVMNSLTDFGEFLKQKDYENYEVFFNVSKQKEKMKKRLKEYNELGDLLDEGKINEEEYGEKIEDLFDYSYFE